MMIEQFSKMKLTSIRVEFGEVTEWLKVRHWKCRVRLVRTVGSNPTLSVILNEPKDHRRISSVGFEFKARLSLPHKL